VTSFPDTMRENDDDDLPRVRVDITRDVIDERERIDFCRDSAAGAIAVFLGTTRDTYNGARVHNLAYECYEPMATRELRAICDELVEKYRGDGDETSVGSSGRGGRGIRAVDVVHRVGDVGVGETSTCVVVSASHRRDACDAASEAIELLKARVPIWKKESFVEGESGEVGAVWKENGLGAFAAKK
jgi:molybdopterin synthase catalytic subunit